jgi:hypothetical protein
VLQYDYWSTLSRSQLANSPENDAVVRFELAPASGGTLLTLSLSHFADASIYRHANFYWKSALQALTAICEQLQMRLQGPARDHID